MEFSRNVAVLQPVKQEQTSGGWINHGVGGYLLAEKCRLVSRLWIGRACRDLLSCLKPKWTINVKQVCGSGWNVSAGGLPEQRRPSQASYGDVSDPVPVQVHDSVDGLAEELHLGAVSACGDALEGQQRTNQSPWRLGLSLDACICGWVRRACVCVCSPVVNASADP